MRRVIKLLGSPHFWGVLIIFSACVILHYPQQIPFLRGMDLSSLLGLSRHAVERIFFLAPIIYAGFVFGLRGGIIVLLAAFAAMLPRVFFISNYPMDALFETLSVITFGALVNWWLTSQRREIGRREQALLSLEKAHRQLESHLQVIKENEKQLSTLHSIFTRANQSLILEEVLAAAADKIGEAIDIDAVLIFFLNEETGQLELKVHRGISEEFASQVTELRIGEGFGGSVAPTSGPYLLGDSLPASEFSPELIKREGIKSHFIAPMKSKDEVIGALCVAAHTLRQFTPEERRFLTLVGLELGVAAQKAYFCQELKRVGSRFQEVFEKAHDAIWIQDFQGKIIAANQATSKLTGFEVAELISCDVSQFLTPQALKLAREVRKNLIAGKVIKQPYEQRIVRKDGTEAIILLTTSLLGEQGLPSAFQHIARDVTEERRLHENLHLYANQISKAHEEERKRIARELHDDTIQAMVAASRRLDSITSGKEISENLQKPLEVLRRDIDDSLTRTRRLMEDLRPPTLEFLGLLSALRELVAQLQAQCSIEVNLTTTGSVKNFSPEDELLIYRIVQEALRNIWRHSGATKTEVAVEFDEDKTVITISDNGKGFNPDESQGFLETGKLGLAGMKERAHLLGGTLTIYSNSKGGTKLTLDIPDKHLMM